MILPLIALVFPSHESTVGHGPERVLLKYKFETGDKYAVHAHLVIEENFTGGDTQPTTTHLDYNWITTSTVQSKNVDESADISYTRTGKKIANGKQEEWDLKIDPNPFAFDPYGRQTHLNGAWHVHAADEIMPTSYFTELPDEPVGIGAIWRTDVFDYPVGKSFAICNLKGFRHRKGHTLVDILYSVITYETKSSKETEYKDVVTPAKGLAKVNMVFDATEGRFLYGEGSGTMTTDLTVPVKGQNLRYKSQDSSVFKVIFTKSL